MMTHGGMSLLTKQVHVLTARGGLRHKGLRFWGAGPQMSGDGRRNSRPPTCDADHISLNELVLASDEDSEAWTGDTGP
jgi:hypothetical protein